MRLTQKPEVSVKAMWEGGPLRRWSATKANLTPMGHAEDGFVGSYVCAECRQPCDGVYFVREEQRWLCGPCKSRVQPTDAGARGRESRAKAIRGDQDRGDQDRGDQDRGDQDRQQ